MAKKEEKIYELKVGDKVFEYRRPPLYGSIVVVGSGKVLASAIRRTCNYTYKVWAITTSLMGAHMFCFNDFGKAVEHLQKIYDEYGIEVPA